MFCIFALLFGVVRSIPQGSTGGILSCYTCYVTKGKDGKKGHLQIKMCYFFVLKSTGKNCKTGGNFT